MDKGLKVSVNDQDGCITLTATDEYNLNTGIMHPLELKTCTDEPLHVIFSVLYKGSVSIGFWGSGKDRTVAESNNWNIATYSYQIPAGIDLMKYYYNPHISTSEGKTVQIRAAKFELGAIQTLAHSEQGKWVLNEAPSQADQLSKCQRWQLVLSKTHIGWAQTTYTGELLLIIPIPTTLRTTPTITLEGELNLHYRNSEAFIKVNSSNISTISNNQSSISATLKNVTSATNGQIYNVSVPTGSKLIVDANL